MRGHLTGLDIPPQALGVLVVRNDRTGFYEVHKDGVVAKVHGLPLKGYVAREQAERVAGRLMQRHRQ